MRVCMPRWTLDRLTEMYCTECAWRVQIPPEQPNWLPDDVESQIAEAFQGHACHNHPYAPRLS